MAPGVRKQKQHGLLTTDGHQMPPTPCSHLPHVCPTHQLGKTGATDTNQAEARRNSSMDGDDVVNYLTTPPNPTGDSQLPKAPKSKRQTPKRARASEQEGSDRKTAPIVLCTLPCVVVLKHPPPKPNQQLCPPPFQSHLHSPFPNAQMPINANTNPTQPTKPKWYKYPVIPELQHPKPSPARAQC